MIKAISTYKLYPSIILFSIVYRLCRFYYVLFVALPILTSLVLLYIDENKSTNWVGNKKLSRNVRQKKNTSLPCGEHNYWA